MQWQLFYFLLGFIDRTIGKGVGSIVCKTPLTMQSAKTNNDCDKCITILSLGAYRNGRMPRTRTIKESIHVFSLLDVIEIDQHLSESGFHFKVHQSQFIFYCGVLWSIFFSLFFLLYRHVLSKRLEKYETKWLVMHLHVIFGVRISFIRLMQPSFI